MSSGLRLTFKADDDGTGELLAEVSANGFSGKSSAWFGVAQLSRFAQILENAYPLPNAPRRKLHGGHWSRQHSEVAIEQPHVGLDFYPFGGLGHIGCLVSLATPLHEHDRAESRPSVQGEVQTTYVQLEKFSRTLDMLAQGNTDEALLQTDA